MQEFNTSESLADSILESFVIFVDFSVFLFSIVLDDVIHVDLCSIEECFGNLWVSVVANFDLLTLNFYLFKQGQFPFFLFCLYDSFRCFLLDAQLGVFLASHIFEKPSFILVISLFLNLVKLDLSFH